MIKEKYEKPFMEVVELKDDVILTSGTSNSCYPADGCSADAVACTKNCTRHDFVDTLTGGMPVFC